MKSSLYCNAERLQDLLTKSGFTTLAAGGCVRDFLLGVDPSDYDLATKATPEQVKQICSANNLKVIDTGLKHGTVSVLIDDNCFEVTTLRVDKECDGRHAEIEYTTSFEQDALRRDLTINSLFMDLTTQSVVDYVGGISDITNRVLRFTGDPLLRIKEDHLRILRLFRFHSRLGPLGFRIAGLSRKVAMENLSLVRLVSRERQRDELLKILTGEIKSIPEEIFFTLIPELQQMSGCTQNCSHHLYDVWIHTLTGLCGMNSKDPILRLAFLLHDIGKPPCKTTSEDGVDHFYDHHIVGQDLAEQIALGLNLSSQEVERIKFLVLNHMRLHMNNSDKGYRRLINLCNEHTAKYGGDWLNDLLEIMICDYVGMKPCFYEKADIIYQEIQRVKEKMGNSLVVKCPLTGYELMDKFKLTPGKYLGNLMLHLKTLIIDGVLQETDKIAAYDYALKFIKESPYETSKGCSTENIRLN